MSYLGKLSMTSFNLGIIMNCSTTNTSFEGDTIDYIPLKVIISIQFALIDTVGTLLYLGIIHYEKWGGDPKKRSLLNQLGSLLCIGIIGKALPRV
jgi:hypothetical protein